MKWQAVSYVFWLLVASFWITCGIACVPSSQYERAQYDIGSLHQENARLKKELEQKQADEKIQRTMTATADCEWKFEKGDLVTWVLDPEKPYVVAGRAPYPGVYSLRCYENGQEKRMRLPEVELRHREFEEPETSPSDEPEIDMTNE